MTKKRLEPRGLWGAPLHFPVIWLLPEPLPETPPWNPLPCIGPNGNNNAFWEKNASGISIQLQQIVGK